MFVTMKKMHILVSLILSGCLSVTKPSETRESTCQLAAQYKVAWLTNDAVYIAEFVIDTFKVSSRLDDIPTAVSQYFSSLKQRESALMMKFGVQVDISNDDYFKRGVGVIKVRTLEGGDVLSWSPRGRSLTAIPVNDQVVISLEESRREKGGVSGKLAAAIGHPIPYSDITARAYKLNGEFLCELLVASEVEYLSKGAFVLPEVIK